VFATVLRCAQGEATMEHNHEGKAEKFAHKFELWVERYGAVRNTISLFVSPLEQQYANILLN